MMDEEIAKRRLLLYTGVRMSGVVLCLIGVAIAYGNVLRAGGWPQVGAAIVIIGALHALVSPHLLKKKWDREEL